MTMKTKDVVIYEEMEINFKKSEGVHRIATDKSCTYHITQN